MLSIRISILLLVFASLSTSGVGQELPDAAMAEQTRKAVEGVSRNVRLYRTLLLQDFDKMLVEQIYGMHGQAWVVEKLEMDADTKIFLSTGFSEHSDRPWRAPDPALVEAIGLDRVRSVNDAQDSALIVIVENVDWVTPELVTLDISSYHSKLGNGIHGSVDLELEFKNNKWNIISNGGCQMRRLNDEG